MIGRKIKFNFPVIPPAQGKGKNTGLSPRGDCVVLLFGGLSCFCGLLAELLQGVALNLTDGLKEGLRLDFAGVAAVTLTLRGRAATLKDLFIVDDEVAAHARLMAERFDVAEGVLPPYLVELVGSAAANG